MFEEEDGCESNEQRAGKKRSKYQYLPENLQKKKNFKSAYSAFIFLLLTKRISRLRKLRIETLILKRGGRKPPIRFIRNVRRAALEAALRRESPTTLSRAQFVRAMTALSLGVHPSVWIRTPDPNWAFGGTCRAISTSTS